MPDHYVGNESFARNLFRDSKEDPNKGPFWAELSPRDRARWRRAVADLIKEGQFQLAKHGSSYGADL